MDTASSFDFRLINRKQRFQWFSCLLLSFGCWGVLGKSSSSQEIDFNRDIRPILSSACFRCHGFDEKKREASLRLDTREGALEKRGEEPAAMIAGHPEQSLVMQRIDSTDPDAVMPPPSAKRQLTAAEKELIKAWIQQGAKYQQHWSFESIRNPAVPEPSTTHAAWNENPIDRFLLQEMLQQGLSPQAEADRRTLIRRVAFTLTGLPPTLSEVVEFESDRSPQAFERMVDHYLASSHYGEEMARHWLDVARYGDTHGLHLDNERQMWAYRDWVVEAFNQNMPFSQFTIEQLAGDLLPNPTLSQMVATGFNRCNVTTSEGGAINEEFLFRYSVDRTSTTIQTWLGLTGGCAVCHDHKYDPLTVKDFYSMYAFFYSAADPAMDGNIDITAPFQKLLTKSQESELQRRRTVEEAARRALLESAKECVASKAEVRTPATLGVVDVWMDDDLPVAAGSRNTTRNAARWTVPSAMEVPMGKRALVQSFGDKYEQVVTGGLIPYAIPEGAQVEVWVWVDPKESPESITFELKTNKGTQRWAWSRGTDSDKRFGVGEGPFLGAMPAAGKWSKLTLDLTATKIPAGAQVEEWKLGQFGGVCYWDGLQCLGTKRASGDQRVDATTWIASRKGKDTPLAEGKVAEALKAGPESEVAKEQAAAIEAFYQAYIAAQVPIQVENARRDWMVARNDLALMESQVPGTFVFRDLAEPRKAHVMTRGQYDQKGAEVEPRTPDFLPPLAPRTQDGKAVRPNRLDLAQWLTSQEHPLPARVTVNRFWQQVFGSGLVRTSDDFGSQGSPPTHPALLEHLAFEFRKNGGDVKQLMKRMVMSVAFRQSSVMTTEALNRDPENKYLARGPRIRLDAEQIRDNALAVSYLLDRSMGGPGVKTYQPPNIWEPVGYGDSNTRYYIQDHGASLYRRSLYCYLKRTAPPPFMSNFDAPNREMFCTRRERSNTPLQALQLMNDVQHFEAARKLAERILKESGTTAEERIRYTFEVVLARHPDDQEIQSVLKALGRFESRMASHPEDAAKMLHVGESPASDLWDSKTLASYTLLCNLILNLDETVVRN